MIIFLTISVALLAAALCFLSARFCISRIEDRQTRTILNVAVSLMTTIIILISIGVAYLPKTASKSLRGGIELLENRLESMYPGIGNEVLDKAELRDIIEQGRGLRGTIARNCGGGIISGYISTNSFLKALELFAGSAESHLDEFEKSGQAFTLHNILGYTEAQLQSTLRETVRWFLVVLLGVSVIMNAFVSLFSVAIFKKWLD